MIRLNKHLMISLFSIILLIIILFCSFTINSFADDPTNPVLEDPVDEDWEPHHSNIVYEYINDIQHRVSKYTVFINTQTGVYYQDPVPFEVYLENHFPSNYSYSGVNYHSGSMHYYQYSRTCISCGVTMNKWESAACPGNGHCIYPQGLPIMPE